jgi:hydroxypyruvate reductase
MTEQSAILRELCLAFFRAGVAAADPQTAVIHYLSDNEHRRFPSNNAAKIHIIAFGKAACAMAKAARLAIPANTLIEPGIIVTTYDNVAPVDGFEVIGAGHPLPDQKGLLAAEKIVEKCRNAKENESVLALISGGGSALLPCPVEGVSLADKIAATELLLACGATINQINCVRKHLSKIKGGGLARLAAPADLQALILSDVLNDDLSTIASGPTVADTTTFADAIEVFKTQQVWDKAPLTVKNYLEQGAKGLHPETLKPASPIFKHTSQTLIGSNAISVDAVCAAAQQQKFVTTIYSKQLAGEARAVAEQWLLDCKDRMDEGLTQASAQIAGGETTVTVTGNGKGGRNQEMALAFALAAEKHSLPCEWTFLSAGTDGRDGPTDTAGGIVDSRTLHKIRAAGIAPEAALLNNDSYTALQAANALVMIGATGTNVADLQILLLHPFTE